MNEDEAQKIAAREVLLLARQLEPYIGHLDSILATMRKEGKLVAVPDPRRFKQALSFLQETARK